MGSPLTERWTLKSWGSACGPAPRANNTPGGPAQVSRIGAELSIVGGGRTFSTAGCWESYPGLARVAHSAGATVWSSVCKTAPTDPRKATVKTTVTASDTQLVLSEDGVYEFALEGALCHASVTRRRTYQRVTPPAVAAPADSVAAAPLPAAAPAANPPGAVVAGASATPAPARVPAIPGQTPSAGVAAEAVPSAAASAKPCVGGGKVASLRLEQSVPWARRGASLELRVDARDAAGCSIEKPRLSWTFEPPGSVSFRGPKLLRISPTAAEGVIRIQARQGDVSAETSVEVVTDARFAELLTRDPSPAGGSLAPTVQPAASAEPTRALSAAPAVAEDEASHRKQTFTWLAAGICALLFGLGIVLLRQGRDKRRRNAASLAPPAQAPVTNREPAPPASAGEPLKVCPKCGDQYESQYQFCGRDGSALVTRR
jgi:hypothetical protein